MNNKLIKPVTYIVTAIFAFIFLALDYFKAIVFYNKRTESEGMTAYEYIEESFRK